jgi:hypothetical protein
LTGIEKKGPAKNLTRPVWLIVPYYLLQLIYVPGQLGFVVCGLISMDYVVFGQFVNHGGNCLQQFFCLLFVGSMS